MYDDESEKVCSVVKCIRTWELECEGRSAWSPFLSCVSLSQIVSAELRRRKERRKEVENEERDSEHLAGLECTTSTLLSDIHSFLFARKSPERNVRRREWKKVSSVKEERRGDSNTA